MIDNRSHQLSILVFSDTGRQSDVTQLYYVSALLVYEMKSGSLSHVLLWSSQTWKRPVRSIGAYEVIAAGEAIDKGKKLVRTVSSIYRTLVLLRIALDSNVL